MALSQSIIVINWFPDCWLFLGGSSVDRNARREFGSPECTHRRTTTAAATGKPQCDPRAVQRNQRCNGRRMVRRRSAVVRVLRGRHVGHCGGHVVSAVRERSAGDDGRAGRQRGVHTHVVHDRRRDRMAAPQYYRDASEIRHVASRNHRPKHRTLQRDRMVFKSGIRHQVSQTEVRCEIPKIKDKKMERIILKL